MASSFTGSRCQSRGASRSEWPCQSVHRTATRSTSSRSSCRGAFFWRPTFSFLQDLRPRQKSQLPHNVDCPGIRSRLLCLELECPDVEVSTTSGKSGVGHQGKVPWPNQRPAFLRPSPRRFSAPHDGHAIGSLPPYEYHRQVRGNAMGGLVYPFLRLLSWA